MFLTILLNSIDVVDVVESVSSSGEISTKLVIALITIGVIILGGVGTMIQTQFKKWNETRALEADSEIALKKAQQLNIYITMVGEACDRIVKDLESTVVNALRRDTDGKLSTDDIEYIKGLLSDRLQLQIPAEVVTFVEDSGIEFAPLVDTFVQAALVLLKIQMGVYKYEGDTGDSDSTVT